MSTGISMATMSNAAWNATASSTAWKKRDEIGRDYAASSKTGRDQMRRPDATRMTTRTITLDEVEQDLDHAGNYRVRSGDSQCRIELRAAAMRDGAL